MVADDGLEVEGYEFHQGTTLKRENEEFECDEYLSYAGGNKSAWTEDARYYNRDAEPHVFNKPPLTLNMVWWMNPWCVIENVQLAEGENKIDLHMNHFYEANYQMKACL